MSLLSSHLALPQEEHLTELFHVFAYRKKHLNTKMVFDPSEPKIDMNLFQHQDGDYSPLDAWRGAQGASPSQHAQATWEGFHNLMLCGC